MRTRTTIGLSLALLLVSATTWAKEIDDVPHHHLAAGIRAKQAKTIAPASRAHAARNRRHTVVARAAPRHFEHHVQRKTLARNDTPRHPQRRVGSLPPPDRYIGEFRVVGPEEVGKAAWYGGRHLGERTASGERLDAIHATAAHRWLPLHSMVRVTNLLNGRSAIATINDRGPVSRSLLIDLSPRVAEELDMLRCGIARVSIVPIAATEMSAR
jgi:rare lipoprotein A